MISTGNNVLNKDLAPNLGTAYIDTKSATMEYRYKASRCLKPDGVREIGTLSNCLARIPLIQRPFRQKDWSQSIV
jgi:hypothetical protein